MRKISFDKIVSKKKIKFKNKSDVFVYVKHNGDTRKGRDVVNRVISYLWRGYDEKIMFCDYRVEEKCYLKMW